MREVRLIDEAGRQVGVIPTDEAKRMAQDRGWDLVEISPQSKPPVCKLLDYGKFLYEQKKKKKQAAKKHHVQQLKEVRLRPKTEKHDIETKVNHARGFLDRGDKVIFTVRFRGRENAHKDQGRSMLEQVRDLLDDAAKMEGNIRAEGNRMFMTLLPKPASKKKPSAGAAAKPASPVASPTGAEGESDAQNEDGESG